MFARLSKYQKAIFFLFLFLTWLFTIWQLDLIRDQFIDQSIFLSREFPELSHQQIFDKVMWEAQFGFPPFCWFGFFFPLQTSFDLMYFLQGITVFTLGALLLKEYTTRVLSFLRKEKKPTRDP